MKLQTVQLGPIGTNCYILSDDAGNTVIVDPGANARSVVKLLQEQQLTPRKILLTHGHFDHVGGVKSLVAAFPDLEVVIGEHDAPMLPVIMENKTNWRVYIRPEDYADLKADVLVKEGDRFSVGELDFEVWETPGHTGGSVCYFCGDILFSGDTLFRLQCGRCDLVEDGGDWNRMLASLRRLAGREGNYQVLSGHGEPSLLDVERRHNPYIREALQSCDCE